MDGIANDNRLEGAWPLIIRANTIVDDMRSDQIGAAIADLAAAARDIQTHLLDEGEVASTPGYQVIVAELAMALERLAVLASATSEQIEAGWKVGEAFDGNPRLEQTA